MLSVHVVANPTPAVRRALPLYSHDAVRRVWKIGNADIFEPIVARHRLLDEILSFFGGRAQPMAQLAEAGKLTLDDVRELEKTIKKLQLEKKAEEDG